MGISDWSSDVCCSELPFRASIRQDLAADEAGGLLRTRSVVRDLSREMAMAAALEESQRSFGQLFAEAPAGIALIDPAGAIQECNVALGRLIGRDPQALRSVSLFDIVAKRDAAPLKAALAPQGDTAGAGKADGAKAPSLDGAKAPSLEVHLANDEGPVCTLFVNRTEGSGGSLAGFLVHFITPPDHTTPHRQPPP